MSKKELKAVFDWTISIIGINEWIKRKYAIESFLDNYYNFKDKPVKLHSKGSVLYEDDVFAWYLYVIEAGLCHIMDHDYAQGARIMPFFETFGYYLELLKSINGVENVIRRISSSDKKQPEGGIFEVAVALAYKRNGCEDVSFVPTSDGKTHDLKVNAKGLEWCVECKQKFTKSDYLRDEKEKWLKMWQPLANSIKGKYKIILDLVFHKELCDFDDNYLVEKIAPKLKSVYGPTVIIDDMNLTVKVDSIDMKRIKKKLEEEDVMIAEFDIAQLITGSYNSIREYSPIFWGIPAKGRRGWIADIEYCGCAIWSCDDEKAYNNKAKSLGGRLKKALKQLPNNMPAILHVGFESHSGGRVENQRYRNILKEVQGVDVGKKDLQWIYCHIYNPKIPPSEDCNCVEACYIQSCTNALDSPLKNPSLLSENSEMFKNVDWVQFD